MAAEPRHTKGLYERLLEEKADEERLRGRPLGEFHGLDSKVLDRQLDNAPPNQSDYKADVYKLYGFINKGVHSHGSAMRFASLKRKYPKEYGEMRAERMGQGRFSEDEPRRHRGVGGSTVAAPENRGIYRKQLHQVWLT